MPLPQNILDAIADNDVHEIEIPAGLYAIDTGEELTLRRDDLSIHAHGVVLAPTGNVTMPVMIHGGVASFTYPSYSHRLGTRVIAADTNQLTIADTTGISVGHVLGLRFGVQIYDSNEPVYQGYFTVTDINGTTVTFDRPFGFACPVYESYAEMESLGADPAKLGDFGPLPSGAFARGLGDSHNVFAFPNGRPYRNVVVDGLTVEWAADSPAYGTWTYSIFFATDSEFRNIRVINPTGSCFHWFSGGNSGVDGLVSEGIGRSEPFGPGSTTFPAILISFWGGENCYAKRIIGLSTNTQLINAEAGSVNSLIDKVLLRSGPLVIPTPHFGIYSTHHGSKFSNVTLDVPQQSSSVFPAAMADVELNNICFLNGVPDFMPMSANFTGNLWIGNRQFGPRESLNTPMTANFSGYTIPRPNGLYRSAGVVLADRDHVTSITGPGEVFSNHPGETTLSLSDGNQTWNTVPPGTVDAYYASYIAAKIWTDGTAKDFNFTGSYHPEIVPSTDDPVRPVGEYLTRYVLRLRLTLPDARAEAFNTWVAANLDATGAAWVPNVGGTCSFAAKNEDADKVIAMLAGLASLTPPTAISTQNRDDKKAWLVANAAEILSATGITVVVSDNDV